MCAGLFGVFLFIAGALVPSAPLSGPPSTSTSTVSDQYVRATPTATDSIALEQGWNLVSSRVVPDAPALEGVFPGVSPGRQTPSCSSRCSTVRGPTPATTPSSAGAAGATRVQTTFPPGAGAVSSVAAGIDRGYVSVLRGVPALGGPRRRSAVAQ